MTLCLLIILNCLMALVIIQDPLIHPIGTDSNYSKVTIKCLHLSATFENSFKIFFLFFVFQTPPRDKYFK